MQIQIQRQIKGPSMRISWNNFLVIATLFISAAQLGSCATAAIATGAGATLGVAAASEGGVKGTWDDFRIQAQINELWFSSDIEMFRKLDLTVNQGRVLITGVVQNPEHRVEAVRLAWQPNGVQQVINEITIAESEGILGFAKDSWIATRLRTAITLNKDVQSLNYNIDVVQGVIYLMGVAQSQKEIDLVIGSGRVISGVKRVVSYVKLVREKEDNQGYSNPASENYSNQPIEDMQGRTYGEGEGAVNYQALPAAPNQDSSSRQAAEAPVQLSPVETQPLSQDDILWDEPTNQ